METKGNWKIQNLSGVIKNFKSAEDPEARAWMKTRGTIKMSYDKVQNLWIPDPAAQEREDKKAARKLEREQKR